MTDEKILTVENVLSAAANPFDSTDRKLIAEAFAFADAAHAGQLRKSGVPYIQHCLATAQILAQIGMDSATVAAGLLHDVPEDTAVTLADVEAKFGKDIAWLVDGVTKLGHLRLRGSREEVYVENLRKMFLAMAQDIRVVIVKLADRLNNMRTLQYVSAEKQERIAKETMEVYAQIANRLGISEVKSELEDLAFRYLDPAAFEQVRGMYTREKADLDRYIGRAIANIRESLTKEGIRFETIKGRSKSLYSLYLKLKRYDMDISRVYDIVAIRIIVPEVADCYEALGIVHKRYRPMVGRIKDYISLPKPNGYQSIHTTVFGPEGRIIEVQIRTQQMHAEAEFGVAAHWFYKERAQSGWRAVLFGRGRRQRPIDQQSRRLQWVDQLRDWQKDAVGDSEEFLRGLKIDFFKNHIFAFTPNGDIIDLPEDSTPVDFAYAIHSEVGDRTTGAKVDGKMVALDYTIRNGQVVEILTAKEGKLPNHDWLTFVRTTSAREHIRRALRRAGRKNIPFPAADAGRLAGGKTGRKG